MNFKIAFWNLPVSKDDSFIGLPQAEFIHGAVNSVDEGKATRYVIEPLSEEWKQKIGTIELLKTSDGHWRLIQGNETAEGVFPRIIEAIEEVESQLKNQPMDTKE